MIMPEKPTYEELEQRIQELEQAESKSKQVDRALLESEEKYRHLSEGAYEAVVWHDKGQIIEANEQYYEMFDYKPEELAGKDAISLTATLDSIKFMREQMLLDYLGPYEVVGLKKGGTEFPMEIRVKNMKYNGKTARMAAIRDLTERKQMEEALKLREKQLEDQTQHLEEVNTAMKVLLKKREEDKIELEKKVLINVQELVFNYLEKLKKSGLESRQKTYVDIMESNLQDIVSPFLLRLYNQYNNLTPSEVQVAELIKQGKTSKEIAELFNLSPKTIESYRENIRKKMGLKNRKINLRTHLLSLQS